MVLSDSRDTVVAKINLITPQLSTNVFLLLLLYIIYCPCLYYRDLL